MFDRAKFEVSLTIERLTRIPYASGKVFIRWGVCDSPRPDAHGRTKSRNISKTSSAFNETTKFKQRIGIRSPSKYLRECEIKFEVAWQPQGGRVVSIGNLSIDLSQFALTYDEFQQRQQSNNSEHTSRFLHTTFASQRANPQEAYGRSLLYLLKGARSNCLLGLRIEVNYIDGDRNYKIPDFEGPAVNFSQSGDDAVESELIGSEEFDEGKNKRSGLSEREKLDNLKEDAHKDLASLGCHRSNAVAKWMDLDQLLMGKEMRILPSDLYKDFEDTGIPGELGIDSNAHKEGTPYLENEMRENFITWNVFST